MNTNRIRYNNEFLQDFCKEHNVTLLKDYSNENINRDSIIEGKCCFNECNENFIKSLNTLSIYKNFGCKYHSESFRKEKLKKTIKEIYGVENVSQSDIIKNKKKQTCLDNYGVEHNSQSLQFKNQFKETCLEKYGVENPLQFKQFKDKSKNTCLERYGVEFSLQSKEVRDKSKETILEKYGVEHPLQCKKVIDKIQQTNLEKYGNICSLHCIENQEKSKHTLQKNYGVTNPSKNIKIQEKKQKTCMKNYGVSSPFQIEESKQKNREVMIEKYEEIQEKKKQTCLEKYGVEHHTQNSDIMEKCSKSAYKLKDYTLPSGNIIKIQGYEHYALDDLLKDNILEEDIINGCKNVPEIWYTDEDNKSHRHYVDIFIPSQNRCIEVKSTWTAEKKKDCIFFKQQAGKELGYNYEIWVYNGKGEKVECYK
jgi:hypothetical protein